MELKERVRLAEPVLEAIPDAMRVLDGKGEVLFVNRACRNLERRPHGELARDSGVIRLEGTQLGQVEVIRDVSELGRLRSELERTERKLRSLQTKYTFQDIVGQDHKLLQAVRQAKSAAATPAAILLRGESGTGKELFAQAIHQHSNRRRERLVAVNCSALPEELLESELFGYAEGSFTGARRGGKPGLFQQANRGTLFLDEIGDISPRVQTRLLRVLQEHEILPVGAVEPIPVDVRIISATHRDLEAMVEAGQFRQDLYYRLNVFPIFLPALRERPGDLEDLVRCLLVRYSELYHRKAEDLEPEAAELLRRQAWRGNIRELENVVTRVLIRVPEDQKSLTRADFAAVLPQTAVARERPPEPQGMGATLAQILEETERTCIRQALEQCGGDKNEAAHRLGLPVRTLYYKCKKLGL